MTTKSEVPASAPVVQTRPRYAMCEILKKNPNTIFDQSQLRACVMEAPMERLIRAASPAYMQADASRLAQSMIVEMGKQPSLATASAKSLIGCLVQASSLGLQFGGPLGQAYLVPYWNKSLGVNEAQLQVGYKGYIFLAHNSPMVAAFDAHPVYECEMDTFDIGHGTDEYVRHKPALRGARTEETLVGCYAYWISKEGRKQVEWMTRDELIAHRTRHAASKNGPWVQHFVEMARKTPLRKLAKRIPMQAIQTAASLDEMADEGIGQQAAAQIVLNEDMPSLTALRAEAAVGADLEDGDTVRDGKVLDKDGMFVRDLG